MNTTRKTQSPAATGQSAEQNAIPIKNSAMHFAAFKRWVQDHDGDLWACVLGALAGLVLPLIVGALR